MPGARWRDLVSARTLTLLLALSACEPVISRSSVIEGKACRTAPETPCLPGYSCRAGVCVATSTLGDETAAAGSSSRLDSNAAAPASGDGVSGDGGTGGAPATDFTTDVDAPVGSAGTGALLRDASDGGGAGAPEAPDTAPAGDAGCGEQMLFRDRDGDGF